MFGVGADGACFGHFVSVVCHLSLLSETAQRRLKYCVKGLLNPKQATNIPRHACTHIYTHALAHAHTYAMCEIWKESASNLQGRNRLNNININGNYTISYDTGKELPEYKYTGQK